MTITAITHMRSIKHYIIIYEESLYCVILLYAKHCHDVKYYFSFLFFSNARN